MKYIKKILVSVLGILLFTSCVDYLDVVPDNTMTLEDVFSKKENAYNALARIYSYLPRVDDVHVSTILMGDEYVGRLDYDERTDVLRGTIIMRGLQTTDDPYIGQWTGSNGGKALYTGLRQCDVFLSYIDMVNDMTEIEIAEWKAQVKFLKAYYCFLLVQAYGPIVIPEQMLTADATPEELFLPRKKVEECFDYIIALMDEAIPELTQLAVEANAGQIDQMVAKAIKAKVLFFRASPIFNGNMELFGDFLDWDGQPFFPLTYDNEKWKDAIDALTDAISTAESHGKGMYTYEKEPYLFDQGFFEINPDNMQKLYDNRMVIVDPWNKELVWGYSGINIYNQGDFNSATNMRLPAAYTGVTNTAEFSWQWLGAPYHMLERFYTKNGLPIEEDLTFDTGSMHEVVITPGAEDEEYAEIAGIFQPGSETLKMYQNREPRFYADFAITGGYWRSHTHLITTMMYGSAQGGYNSSQHTTDYYPTGIGIKRWVHPENMSGAWQRTIKYPYPLIRMADLYLMKAEALNEYNSAPTQDVYDLVNKIRERAGIPNVETVWRDANLAKTQNRHTTKEGMREIILEERAIEFAFEGSRYWDMWRHKRATSAFSSPIMGWNHAGTGANTFFVLSVKQARVYKIRDYLWPIKLDELNTNGQLIQNPGW